MNFLRYFRPQKDVVLILRLAGSIRNAPGDGGPSFRPPRHLNVGKRWTKDFNGFEWRKVTAGKNKMRLDPFEPLREEDVAWVRDIMEEVHNNFIEHVKSRRKAIDLNHKTVFTGDIFTAARAVNIGLIDGTESDVQALIRRKYGEEVKIERVKAPRQGLAALFGGRTGPLIDTGNLLNDLTDKSLYSRYGR